MLLIRVIFHLFGVLFLESCLNSPHRVLSLLFPVWRDQFVHIQHSSNYEVWSLTLCAKLWFLFLTFLFFKNLFFQPFIDHIWNGILYLWVGTTLSLRWSLFLPHLIHVYLSFLHWVNQFMKLFPLLNCLFLPNVALSN